MPVDEFLAHPDVYPVNKRLLEAALSASRDAAIVCRPLSFSFHGRERSVDLYAPASAAAASRTDAREREARREARAKRRADAAARAPGSDGGAVAGGASSGWVLQFATGVAVGAAACVAVSSILSRGSRL